MSAKSLRMKKQKEAKGPESRNRPSPFRLIGERPATVLHIDDDANDAELLEAAMRKAKASFVLHSVCDGEKAVAYLTGQGAYQNRTRFQIPSLILLDLKMPRATGFEVLKWIRSHKSLGDLPVVVLSGSELLEDIQRAYAAGANSYLIKPLGFSALVRLVQEVEAEWLPSLRQKRGSKQHEPPTPVLRPKLPVDLPCVAQTP
jgi:CheY-like chemotaxis protein